MAPPGAQISCASGLGRVENLTVAACTVQSHLVLDDRVIFTISNILCDQENIANQNISIVCKASRYKQ